jgi:hypothetical protein
MFHVKHLDLKKGYDARSSGFKAVKLAQFRQ